jgi:dUTP pyrophosphatase
MDQKTEDQLDKFVRSRVEELRDFNEKMSPKLRVKRLRSDAVLPRRATSGSAGYDLFLPTEYNLGTDGSRRDIYLAALTPSLVRIGLAMEIPRHSYGRIAPRSGLALQGVQILGGVIDSDFRDEVGIILCLIQPEGHSLKIDPAKAIAQLILEQADFSTPIEEVSGELSRTHRTGGFGSTDR